MCKTVGKSCEAARAENFRTTHATQMHHAQHTHNLQQTQSRRQTHMDFYFYFGMLYSKVCSKEGSNSNSSAKLHGQVRVINVGKHGEIVDDRDYERPSLLPEKNQFDIELPATLSKMVGLCSHNKAPPTTVNVTLLSLKLNPDYPFPSENVAPESASKVEENMKAWEKEEKAKLESSTGATATS